MFIYQKKFIPKLKKFLKNLKKNFQKKIEIKIRGTVF